MAKIRINASDARFRKRVSSAQEEFLRHYRLCNRSSRTKEYYRENLSYIRRVLKLEYVDELTKDRVDHRVVHVMNQSNKVVPSIPEFAVGGCSFISARRGLTMIIDVELQKTRRGYGVCE